MNTASALRAAIQPLSVPVSIGGKVRPVPALKVDDHLLVVSGNYIKFGKIFDAYWIEAAKLPDPGWIVEQLSHSAHRPDVFTFTQRVPDTNPAFDYQLDWDNVAVVRVSSHEHWLQKQISSASRRNIKTSEKKGVTVRVCQFDADYIRGIMAISDESPIRAGRKYWHYGKDFATVEAEQGTYRDRSVYLGAFVGDEMIGYLKLVPDVRTAAIMQIVSKLAHLDKRPNNALLSEAVKVCAARGISYLQYERYVYGKKEDSSLTRFKRENGFERMDVPSYYVPLTVKGQLALKLGLHRNLKDRLPQWVINRLLRVRDKWYSRQVAKA